MSGDGGGVATEPAGVTEPATASGAAARARPGPSPRTGFATALLRGLGRHWLLLVLLAGGAALRAVSVLAYPPALLYIDSYRYLYNLGPLDPAELDPVGYNIILKPLLAVGGLQLAVLVQHLLGLGIALACYVLARRYGVRNWLAALATAPVLLDAYQVQIEQNIMSDLWLEALLVAIGWLLLRRGAPGPAAAGVAGLLLGVAVTVRTIALPLLLPLLLFLVVAGGAWRSRAGWRRIGARAGALLLCCGLVLFCYAGYFHRETGRWGLTGSSDSVEYGRTADLADCGTLKLAPELRQLCPKEPLGARKGVDWYAHLDGDPNWPGAVPAGMTVQQLQHRFAVAVIEQQPVDVVEAVLADFGKGFAVGRTSSPDDVPVARWQFQAYYPIWTSLPEAVFYTEKYAGTRPGVRTDLARFLRGYQLGGGYTPGPALAAFAVLGLAGSVWRRRSGVRSAAALITGSGLFLLLCSAMFEFSWRYQLPGLVLLPLGGVIGLAGLIGPVRRPGPRHPRLRAFGEDADWHALRGFTARYGPRRFAPVLLLCRDAVPAGVPAECAGLPVECLVLTGDADRLSTVDDPPVCVVPLDRGPGGALRVGLRLAGYGGARYVAALRPGADPAGLAAVLAPVAAGEADLALGSSSRSRSAGAGLVVLRTGLAARLDLREPDFPAAELPAAARAAGATVRVIPITGGIGPAPERRPGTTGVVLRTWLRARRGRRSPGGPGSP